MNLLSSSSKIVLTLIPILLSLSALGQKWENPADKYKDAYKKYLPATCPIEEDNIKHFVYFSRDRAAIIDHPFLQHTRFEGAQIMYSWRQLEPKQGEYDFSILREDYQYLLKHNKQLFIQLQDVTFNPVYKAVPNYLLAEEYAGGAVEQYDDRGKAEGWVSKRWNEAVQARFKLLLIALGKEFDGKIEGINLQETSIGVSQKTASDFTEEKYVAGIKANMLALKQAFPTSTTMIYANFVPGEWLPWDDKGYLRGIYAYGEEIGVGLGAPDLLIRRKGQLNNPLTMMHEEEYSVPLGIAIQDGNYVGKTGADEDYAEEKDLGNKNRSNRVPLLHAFAQDFLKVNYMFWVNQAPYFEEDVLSCFEEKE